MPSTGEAKSVECRLTVIHKATLVVLYRAGRLMIDLISGLVARGESFAFETTLADRGHARRIIAWQAVGYRITVLFLALPSLETAIQRARERVAQGAIPSPRLSSVAD